MLAERAGLYRPSFVLLLFGLILALGVAISIRSQQPVRRADSAIGVTAMLFIHLFINVAMVMGLIPVVGVPLPLLSYGGSILVTMMLGFGLVLNVYVHRSCQVSRAAKRF